MDELAVAMMKFKITGLILKLIVSILVGILAVIQYLYPEEFIFQIMFGSLIVVYFWGSDLVKLFIKIKKRFFDKQSNQQKDRSPMKINKNLLYLIFEIPTNVLMLVAFENLIQILPPHYHWLWVFLLSIVSGLVALLIYRIVFGKSFRWFRK